MSIESSTDAGRSSGEVRFIKIGREIVNLNAIAYVTISERKGKEDAIIALERECTEIKTSSETLVFSYTVG